MTDAAASVPIPAHRGPAVVTVTGLGDDDAKYDPAGFRFLAIGLDGKPVGAHERAGPWTPLPELATEIST